MDRREKKRTVPAVLAAAVCLGLLLGTVFAAVSSGMQRKTVEQIISCTIKEEPELAGKVTAILKESSAASVSREGREWLDRYGYTAASGVSGDFLSVLSGNLRSLVMLV